MNIKNKINELSSEIQEKQKEIVELCRMQEAEPVEDYELKDKEGRSVRLTELFGDSDELLLIHNMGMECKYCTMWADGFRGFAEIISDRMPWLLTSPNSPETLKNFSESRNWNFKVLSFEGTSFAKDLGYQTDTDGKAMYHPGVSALIKKEEKIYRTGNDSFGPGDLYNPAWHFFDLFPKGANGWQPKYIYTQKDASINLLD